MTTLAGLMRPKTYPKNGVILFAHDTCEAFYILVTGQVKVTLVSEDGREVILSLVRTGDFFGERSLMDDEPHAASVIAMEESQILVLRREDFRRCIMDMPGVAFGLLRVLLHRLRLADHKIGGLVLLDVLGRVCGLILQLADQNDGHRIPDLPTHQVMGQMVGTSRESVTRAMSTLTEQGVIDVHKTELVIKNREALETAAGQVIRRKASAGRHAERRSAPVPITSSLPRR